MLEKNHFLGSNPISKVEDDLFNFKHYALKVQQLLQHNSSNSDPLTIGIYGKWGEGKTSFLNLLENKIDLWKKEDNQKGILKYHFNPWRYSTEEEMLFDFFDGLAKAMFVEKDTNLQKAGKGILRFSKYLKAVKLSASAGFSKSNKASITFEPSEIFKALGEDLIGKNITLELLKNKINDSLKLSNYKVVVFIDDIDRLDKNEIYTILKIIKLNASFDNFVYIITLDDEQVSKAISKRYGSKKKDGELFLEKIINIPIHLPRVEKEDLRNFFEKKIAEIRNNLPLLKLDKTNIEFNEIRNSFSSSYFKSPREIIRVLNSFFIGAFAIGDEVNLFDLFWLEYLKVKYSKAYSILKNYSYKNNAVFFLEETLDLNDGVHNERDKVYGTRLDLFETAIDSIKIIDFLFPIEQEKGTVFAKSFDKEKMKSELRVNTTDNFDKYFSYHTIRKVSNIDVYKLEEAILSKNSDIVRGFIIKISNDMQDQTHKVFYILDSLVKRLNIEKGRDFFYEFLFDNFSLLPQSEEDIFGLDYKLRLIELISKNLDNDEVNDNSKLIIKLAKKINATELCHLTRKIKNDKHLKQKLFKLIADKVKVENNKDSPFYMNVRDQSNKMKMLYWKEHNEKEYFKFIEASINSKDRLTHLIRNFAPFWNNEFFGGLDYENYKYIKKLMDIKLLYKKTQKYYSKIENEVIVDSFVFSDHDRSTLEDNLKQFIFFYKKDNGFK